ncbi:MAG: MATE family efflux transporter [Pseudomonadota bacterium]
MHVSHRKVWKLAIPIILANLSVPLVGAVDTAVVGQLPEPAAIGAVALGALIFSFLYWGFGFLRMGTSGFVAQAYGAKNRQVLSETLVRALLLALLLGLLTILLAWPLISLVLYLIDSSVRVESMASGYSYIRIWSAPAVLSIYVFAGVFIGLQDTRAVLLIQLVLNLTNVALDFLFVSGFGWGVEGVAIASLVAEYTAMFLGLYLLRHHLSEAFNRFNRARLFDRTALSKLFDANFNIFIRTLCVLFAFSYFTGRSASLGDVVLAANAILMHLNSFMAYTLDGFAHAAEAISGSAYGARDRKNFRKSVALTSFWAFVVSLVIAVIFLLTGDRIIEWFTSIPVVSDTARQYLLWMVLMPIVAIWSFQLDGIFIGATHTREMRHAMIISLVFYLVVVQLSLPVLGNHGLFLSLILFMVMRAVTLLFHYRNIENAMNVQAS